MRRRKGSLHAATRTWSSRTCRACTRLSPYSPEEVVTRDYLLEGGPDAVVNLVDATNLERNLYLTTQILDLGVPVVVALNMMDLVKKNGDKIDVARLVEAAGLPRRRDDGAQGARHGRAHGNRRARREGRKARRAEDALRRAGGRGHREDRGHPGQPRVLGNRALVRHQAVRRRGAHRCRHEAQRCRSQGGRGDPRRGGGQARRRRREHHYVRALQRHHARRRRDDEALAQGHDHHAEDRPRGDEPLAGPAHLRGGHGARVLPGHLRGHGRGHRLGQRRRLRRRLSVHRRRGLRRGRGRMGRVRGRRRGGRCERGGAGAVGRRGARPLRRLVRSMDPRFGSGDRRMPSKRPTSPRGSRAS